MSETPADGATGRFASTIDQIPYLRFLGVRIEFAGDEMTAILPYSKHLIGNPMVPALHGGVVGAFMEVTALAQVSAVAPVGPGEAVSQPRTIGVTIEYLRSGRPIDTFARAEVKRIGRRVANVFVEAWQDRRSAPIAAMSARFLLTPSSRAP